MKVDPYLFFDGNCEVAFRFYATLFGARIEAMQAHRGSPAEGHVPESWLDKILHARLVWDDVVLMASDAPPGQFEKPAGFSISLNVQDIAEAERVFLALSEGGEVRMALGKTFWASRFGMCVDQFGIPWMVNCE